ncbi:MAG: protein kinase [Planctomycetota bacterium]|nr:protein kinase [Planctomycetota bacterium]
MADGTNPSAARNSRLDEAIAAYLAAAALGQMPDRQELLHRHPDLAADLAAFFAAHDRMHAVVTPPNAAADAAPTPRQPGDATLPPRTPDADTLPPQATATEGATEGATLPASGTPTPPALDTNVRYFGDYELVEEIARGGMGVVYKARQVKLNRIVALKMILAGQLAGEDDVKRFYTEAEAAAKLDHPGIVPIFEIGQHEGQHYFSMGYIEGISLAKKVADGPLPPREAAEMVVKIAAAVEYAHQQGIIHRDLKPANVLLDAHGQPRVTDFGLAKQLKADSGLTNTGQILGTPSFMPPEQAAGKIDEIGPAADVYALGAILYCLLTGRPPFQSASPMDTLLAVLGQEPVSPRQLNAQTPLDLETIALKCLEKSPARRYATAQDLAEDLQRFIDDEPIKARRVSSVERLARWSRHNRGLATSLATVAMLVSLLAVGATIAASYFRAVSADLNLANQDLTSRTEQLTESRNESLTMLADMQTDRGFHSGRDGDTAAAAHWFANAAWLTPHDPVRQAASRLRARNWLNDSPVPAALLKLPDENLRRLLFQPAGSLLLTLHGTRLRVWDWRNEQALAWTESLTDVTDAGWSPDGRQLAVACSSGLVQLHEPVSGFVQHRFQHPESVEVLQWAPDGRQVAVAGTRVQVWNVTAEPKCEQDWPHPQKVTALAFNRSGDRLATACEDNRARLFAIGEATGLSAPLFAPVEHGPFNLCAPVFCRGDRQLVTAAKGSQPRWWEVDTGREVTPKIAELNDCFDRQLAGSPDGQWIFVTGGNSCLAWNADGQNFPLVHGNLIRDVTFDPQRSVLMTTCMDGKSRLWAIPPLGRSPLTLPQMETYTACAFSTDGSFAAIASSRQVVIWQLHQQEVVVGHIAGWTEPNWLPRPGFDGRLVAPGAWHETPWGLGVGGNALSVALMSNGQPAGPTISLEGPLADSCLCADNRSVAAACVADQGGMLAVFDVATGVPAFPAIDLPTVPISVAARPGQPQVAVLCKGGQLWVVNTTDGSLAFELTHAGWSNIGSTQRVRYTPDGTTLLTITTDNAVLVREAESGQLRFPAIQPVVEGGPCRTIAISPDSRLLATGVTGKNIVRVWDLATGQPAGPELLHPGDFYGIYTVAFSPNGERILSGHKDGRLRLWDWKAGKIVGPPMQNPDEVADVRFTPDGRYALAAVKNSTVHLWDLATGKLAAAPIRYPLPSRGSTVALGIAGSQVVASAPGYPVLDLSVLLGEPDAEIESLLAQAELSSNQKLQFGEPVPLEQSEWDERWARFATSRLTSEAAAEALARTLDASADDSARQLIAERAARTHLLERLLKLRPDVPQLHVVVAHEFARRGDHASAAKHRSVALEALQRSLGKRVFDPATAAELARLMIEDLSVNWTRLEPTDLKTESGCTLTRQPDGSLLAGPGEPRTDSYSIRGRSSRGQIAALRLETLPHAGLQGGGPGNNHGGNFLLTEIHAVVQRADGTTAPLKFRSAAADKVRPVDHDTTVLDGPWGTIDDNHATHWDIAPFPGKPHWLTLQFADPCDMADDDELIVQLEFRDLKYPNARIGCFRLSVSGEEHAVETEQLIAAIREHAVSGLVALAAAQLATGHPDRAAELLRGTLEPSRPSEAGPRCLLLAKAQQKLGHAAAAHEACNQFVEWLRTRNPPRLWQQLAFEVVTEIGGLEPKQFHALLDQVALEQQLARLTKEIERAPTMPTKYGARGELLARSGRWRESAEDYGRELKLNPQHRWSWMRVASCWILAGDEPAYQQHCRELAAQFGNTDAADVADTVCKISLLRPGVIDLSELPIQKLQAATSDPKWEPGRHGFNATCALISYRAGDYETAAARAMKVSVESTHPGGALALAIRAMAEYQLDRTEQARRTLAQVETYIPIELRTLGTPDYQGPLPVLAATAHYDWLIAEILRREAAALINGGHRAAVPEAPDMPQIQPAATNKGPASKPEVPAPTKSSASEPPASEARTAEPVYHGKPASYWIERLGASYVPNEIYGRSSTAEPREALKALGPAAVPALITVLKHENQHVRSAAAIVLVGLGPEAAVAAAPALLEASYDWHARHEALNALKQMGPAAKAVVPEILERLSTLAVEQGRELRSVAGAAAMLVFSPDGRLLATSGAGPSNPQNTIILRNAETLEETRTITSGQGLVASLAFIRGPQSSPPQRQRLPFRQSAVSAFSFSPDGKTLALAGPDRKVCGWDVASGQQRYALDLPRQVAILGFLPDGRSLVTWTANSSCYIVEVPTHAP